MTLPYLKFRRFAGRSGNSRWTAVTPPVGFTWELPFTIVQSGRNFAPAPSFSPRTRAGISVTKTYYLNTVTGDNGNNGTTPATPKKTWNNIMDAGDYDRVIIQDGSTLIRAEGSQIPTRSVEVIGEGTVYWTSYRAVGAWTLTTDQTNTYQAGTNGEYIAYVYDHDTLDAQGLPTRFTRKASIAEVEAQAGSFYWAANVVYVHTLDDTDPTGQAGIRTYDSSAILWQADALTWYIENIRFIGGVGFQNATAAGGTKVYLDRCSGQGIEVFGIDEYIARAVTLRQSMGDGTNYDVRNTKITNAIEINCNSGYSGLTNTSQATTAHNGCRIVRINGQYHHTSGQNSAEANATTLAYMLGCVLSYSTTGVGYYTEGTAWMDSCAIHNNTTDIQTATGATVYIRDLISGGNYTGDGTVTAY